LIVELLILVPVTVEGISTANGPLATTVTWSRWTFFARMRIGPWTVLLLTDVPALLMTRPGEVSFASCADAAPAT
jgi:hypothetical protein